MQNKLKNWLTPIENNLPELYLVGGSIRDLLLQRQPKDIDLVCRQARKTAETLAAAHHAAFVPFQKKADQPCFRVVDRNDPDNVLDIAEIQGQDIYDDLNNRDFTINALAARVDGTGYFSEIIDPLNGQKDLKDRIIRMAGRDAFHNDPLRMVRAFRFAAKLDFTIHETTKNAISNICDRIRETASERVLYELMEIFKTDRSAAAMRLMDETGLLDKIFPEILPMKGCTQNDYHHLDVWAHSLAVLEKCEIIMQDLESYFNAYTGHVQDYLALNNHAALLKLGALLHDIGKPGSRNVKETGRVTFYGHHTTGADMAEQLAQRLRMANRDRVFLCMLITEHMHIINLIRPEVKASTRMRWFRRFKDDVIPVVIHGIADVNSTCGPLSDEAYRRHFQEKCREIITEYFTFIKPRLEKENLITGRDLTDLSMKPGPALGKILKKVREAQDSNMFQDRKEAIAYAKSLLPPS